MGFFLMMSWHESEDSLQEKVTKLKIRSLIERFDRLNFECGDSIGLCFNDVMARVGRLAPVRGAVGRLAPVYDSRECILN
jgi:hypothetical protein